MRVVIVSAGHSFLGRNPYSPLACAMDAIDDLPSWAFDTFLMVCWSISRPGALKVSTSDRNSPPSLPQAISPPTWHPPPPKKWLAPPSGNLKLNVDGAWNVDRRIGGYGGVFRHDRGCFVAAKCGHFLNAFSPLQAEALAFRELLVWASVRGFSKYHIWSDSLQIVDALKDPSPNLSLISQVVEDIMALLSSITGASSTHARCQSNGVVHRLDRIGVTSSQSSEWLVAPQV